MAFPAIGDYNTGVCPQSHPTAIFSIFLEFFYDTSPFPDYQNLVYAMGDLTGCGLHGDFINGWTNLTALQDAFATCGSNGLTTSSPGCSITGGHVQGAQPQTSEVTPPTEDVGLTDPIAALPGTNPVTGTVADRTH
jgi:hypothetical protein